MKNGIIAGLCAASLVLPAATQAKHGRYHHKTPQTSFNHVASFNVMAENGSSVAEIVDVSYTGRLLAYTDGGNGAIGFVDISNPANPIAKGTLDVGGEPTSLALCGPVALVAQPS